MALNLTQSKQRLNKPKFKKNDNKKKKCVLFLMTRAFRPLFALFIKGTINEMTQPRENKSIPNKSLSDFRALIVAICGRKVLSENFYDIDKSVR